MNVRKKFLTFYKFPLTYNPEICTKPSVCKSDSHFSSFFYNTTTRWKIYTNYLYSITNCSIRFWHPRSRIYRLKKWKRLALDSYSLVSDPLHITQRSIEQKLGFVTHVGLIRSSLSNQMPQQLKATFQIHCKNEI